MTDDQRAKKDTVKLSDDGAFPEEDRRHFEGAGGAAIVMPIFIEGEGDELRQRVEALLTAMRATVEHVDHVRPCEPYEAIEACIQTAGRIAEDNGGKVTVDRQYSDDDDLESPTGTQPSRA